MKKARVFFILSFLIFLFVSCASTIAIVNNEQDITLKEDEGFVLLRIINPTAGKTIEEFYDQVTVESGG